MLAVIKQGKNQYSVCEGDVIKVQKVDLAPEANFETSHVLLAKDDKGIKIGTPYIAGAKVKFKVVGHEKGPKVINFRYKKKKNYHRTVGSRQLITLLKVESIKLSESKKA